ncbi:MAG: hypothetical protein OEZ01_06605 [Candidatus Heimdallarchaeota archaeon]|nr:hypothetical protein [Candidatus Heimdallarchaeota archaeon]MDH5645659.1 hypothetical protein [Candidatus Heimdallarchaeota archaeon]
MTSIGKVGIDVHKKERPQVAESGGIGFMLIYIIVLSIGLLFVPNHLAAQRLSIMIVVLFLVYLIGIYDDFKKLSAIIKPLILLLASLPVFIFRVASPNPILPFVGATRLTIVYWFIAVFVVAITSNASNMLDVMNGVMVMSGIFISITAFISSFILEDQLPSEAIYITRFASLSLCGVLFAFYLFNKYPAKVFAGDTGSLGVGSAIGLIAIYGQIEFLLIVALLLHIMNSFTIISSVKGLKERSQMKSRPVVVEDGIIHANKDKSAPITLVRLLVAGSPKTEKQVIQSILSLVLFCCILAIITAFFMRIDIL